MLARDVAQKGLPSAEDDAAEAVALNLVNVVEAAVPNQDSRSAPPRGIRIFRFPRRLEDRLAGMFHPQNCTCTGCYKPAPGA